MGERRARPGGRSGSDPGEHEGQQVEWNRPPTAVVSARAL
ncbi:hypothetical protein FHU36_002068 [Nonomuraea muscovyensis]|uniref:Uncharacterized protein n=1 Tax=Nonomuraea muscovyensis TaxID=1124761 RepID=A0A7X0EXN6_9ACTN|nr:hypothetical protein [Nonomuraea muscovyensis]